MTLRPAGTSIDLVAATSWAAYAVLLGYLGGKALEEQPWKGLVAALAIAGAVTGGIELLRWRRPAWRISS